MADLPVVAVEERGSDCGWGENEAETYELCSNHGGHTIEWTNYQLAELIWSGPQNVTGAYCQILNLCNVIPYQSSIYVDFF